MRPLSSEPAAWPAQWPFSEGNFRAPGNRDASNEGRRVTRANISSRSARHNVGPLSPFPWGQHAVDRVSKSGPQNGLPKRLVHSTNVAYVIPHGGCYASTSMFVLLRPPLPQAAQRLPPDCFLAARILHPIRYASATVFRGIPCTDLQVKGVLGTQLHLQACLDAGFLRPGICLDQVSLRPGARVGARGRTIIPSSLV